MKYRKRDRSENLKKRSRFGLCELIIAMILEVPLFTSSLYYSGYGQNYTSVFYGLATVLLFFAVWSSRIQFLSGWYCVAPLILLIFFVPSLFNPMSRIGTIEFLMYCILPFIIYFKRIESNRLLKYVVRLSLLSAPLLPQIIRVGEYGAMEMPIAYGLMPSIISSILILVFFSNKIQALDWIGVALNAFYCANIIVSGNRGQLVTLVVLFALIYIGKTGKTKECKKSKRLFRLLIILCISVVAVFAIDTILNILISALGCFGIQSYGLARSALLEARGIGADTYRIELYSAALNGFCDSPIIGHGLRSFSYINSSGNLFTYPHNMFLQLLYDGGIILFSFVAYYLVKGCCKIIVSQDITYYIVFILLFSIAVPHFMFSSDVFLQADLWLLLGFLNYELHSSEKNATFSTHRKQGSRRFLMEKTGRSDACGN